MVATQVAGGKGWCGWWSTHVAEVAGAGLCGDRNTYKPLGLWLPRLSRG